MSLIKCYECSKKISNHSNVCVHCGSPRLITCYECSNLIPSNSDSCPNCGAKNKITSEISSFIIDNKIIKHLFSVVAYYFIVNLFLMFLVLSSSDLKTYSIGFIDSVYWFFMSFSLSFWIPKLLLSILIYITLLRENTEGFRALPLFFKCCFVCITLCSIILPFGRALEEYWPLDGNEHLLIIGIVSISIILSVLMHFIFKKGTKRQTK